MIRGHKQHQCLGPVTSTRERCRSCSDGSSVATRRLNQRGGTQMSRNAQLLCDKETLVFAADHDWGSDCGEPAGAPRRDLQQALRLDQAQELLGIVLTG